MEEAWLLFLLYHMNKWVRVHHSEIFLLILQNVMTKKLQHLYLFFYSHSVCFCLYGEVCNVFTAGISHSSSFTRHYTLAAQHRFSTFHNHRANVVLVNLITELQGKMYLIKRIKNSWGVVGGCKGIFLPAFC